MTHSISSQTPKNYASFRNCSRHVFFWPTVLYACWERAFSFCLLAMFKCCIASQKIDLISTSLLFTHKGIPFYCFCSSKRNQFFWTLALIRIQLDTSLKNNFRIADKMIRDITIISRRVFYRLSSVSKF